MKARVREVYLLPTHQNGFSSVVSQLPYTYLNIFLLYVTNKQIFSLLELKIKLMYWQISTAASQVFILKIIIFNSSWLISLKLKLVLWQLGIISQMPAQRRAQSRRMWGTRLCCHWTCPTLGHPMSVPLRITFNRSPWPRDQLQMKQRWGCSSSLPLVVHVQMPSEWDTGWDAWSELAPLVSHLHPIPLKSGSFPS